MGCQNHRMLPVIDKSPRQNNLTKSIQTYRPGRVDLRFEANDEYSLAQTTAFYWVNRAYEFVKPHLAPFHLATLSRLKVSVNNPNLPSNSAIHHCNASATENHLAFLTAGV